MSRFVAGHFFYISVLIKKIFKYQFYHLILLLILLGIIVFYINNTSRLSVGNFWGISTKTWFWIALIVPVLHQIYVWLVWRLELYGNIFTGKFGIKKAFLLYSAGFSILFISRLVFIIILAISNSNTLFVNPFWAYLFAVIITPPIIYLEYSVKKYFTVERAFGIDHFDKNFNKPFVKEGIFRYIKNAMYVVGLMVLYLPGLLLLSEAALVAALFNHIYIWVHYYTTELPDIKEIYKNVNY